MGAQRAYLNYVLLDEKSFKAVQSGFVAVPQITGTTQKQLLQLNSGSDISITHNGYLYVYVSNESKGNVYFDDIRIEHQQGSLLEENHFYPYGLKMAALSSKAYGSLLNKFQYQGDYSENDEETGYDEFTLRDYDPQLGRWTGVDPYDEFPSPYTGMGNDPINNVDPSGGGIGDILPSVSDLGSDFLNAAGNTLIATGVGAGIGYLINGKKGAEWGAGIGFAVGAGSYVPWGDVFNWFGGFFQGGGWTITSTILAQSAFNGAGSGDDWNRDPNPKGIKVDDLSKESNNELLNDIRSTIHTYTRGVMQDVGDKMVDHLGDNTGTDFSDETLNNHIAASSQFQDNFNDALQRIKDRILGVNGDLSKYGAPKRFDPPNFPKTTPDLKTLVGGTQYAAITLTRFKFNARTKSFQGRITTTIMDDFGVSAPDVNAASNIPFSKGIRSFWYLQHVRGFKPFRTIYSRQSDISF